MATNKELIDSEEFEKALVEGAEYKNNMMVSYKTQNKSNFARFSEIMFEANDEVKAILETRKKNRTDVDKKTLADFKNAVRTMYGQTQVLSLKEDLEEGQKSRIEKIVEKIVPVIDILRYIGNNELEQELAKHGITVTRPKLDATYPALASQDKQDIIKDIFSTAVALKQKAKDDNEVINSDIYTTKVPTGLQFDKNSNNSGLKASDFRKLVDMKAKLLSAKSDDAKEKVDEKIEHVAAEKQFEAARAELVRDRLTTL